MPICHLFTVTEGSSKSENNLLTLTRIVENITILLEKNQSPDQMHILPLQVHANFSFAKDEIGQQIEVGFILKPLNESAQYLSFFAGVPFQRFFINPPSQRHRICVQNLAVYMSGDVLLTLVTRKQDTESWSELASWPLNIVVEREQSPESPTPSPTL